MSAERDSFPLDARVLLKGLKADQYNGKTGTVYSALKDGRQQVKVDGDKTLNIRPSNLAYVTPDVDTLSVTELKTVLKSSGSAAVLAGMDVSDLRTEVSKLELEEIAHLLAKENEPQRKPTPAPTTPKSSISKDQFREGAERMSQMSPEQIRQQASMMRSMDPATLRRMNPQLAHMTDDQIKMAADQMEMMATNPEMLRMASQQMRNMSPEQINRAYQQQTSQSAPTAVPSREQMKQQITSLSPEQLRSQAHAMRTMDPDVLRRTNPQLAGMSNEQIMDAANQMEMMASNPEAFNAMKNQVSNMTPEQIAAMQSGQVPIGGSGSSSEPMDPMKMMESMDGQQLKSMMSAMKSNPEMLKTMLKSDPRMANVSEEELMKQMEMFDKLDEKQLERMVGLVKGANKVAAPVKKAYEATNKAVGGHLPKLLILVGAILIVLLIRYLVFSSGGDVSTSTPLEDEMTVPEIPTLKENEATSEFDTEF